MLTQLRIAERDPDAGEQEILDLQPEVDMQMGLVLEAWQELDSERYLGFAGAGKIPVTEIYEWGVFNRMDYELILMVAGAIRYCDSERAERIASEQAHDNGGG